MTPKEAARIAKSSIAELFALDEHRRLTDPFARG